jgi:hypothetical protein
MDVQRGVTTLSTDVRRPLHVTLHTNSLGILNHFHFGSVSRMAEEEQTSSLAMVISKVHLPPAVEYNPYVTSSKICSGRF